MNIVRKVHKINSIAPKLPEGNYLAGRIGFWAIVTEQNSTNNTVTVVSDTGFELPNIPVMSREWVTLDKNKKYVPSQRNLPPKNSWVFVLTPTFTATGAFVLCSGFTRGDKEMRELWAQDESELEDKNNSRELKTQGGWDITEEYANGNFSAVSNDEKISITINTTEDSEKSQNKEIAIKAWDNKIIINEDGIEITDVNKNSIKMTDSDIKIEADSAKKIKIGNSSDTLKSLFEELVSTLDRFQTAGSPANHTAIPNQFTGFNTKLNKLFEG